jgi:DNA-binding GntR family transcriptional regulator
LAREFRVSTGVVREALLEIQPLGVFQKRDRYRWSVVSFDDAHIRHLREFREMVEIFALRQLFSRGAAAPLDALAQNRQKTEALLADRQTTVRAILEVDLEFHRLLLESAGNPLLLDRAGFVYLIIEFQLVSPLFRLERGKDGLRQHLRIHRAIREHRAPAAERELRLHLRAADASFCAIVRKMDRRNSRS